MCVCVCVCLILFVNEKERLKTFEVLLWSFQNIMFALFLHKPNENGKVGIKNHIAHPFFTNLTFFLPHKIFFTILLPIYLTYMRIHLKNQLLVKTMKQSYKRNFILKKTTLSLNTIWYLT